MSEQTNPEITENQVNPEPSPPTLWDSILNWLKAPVFEDDLEKNRIASVLYPILITLFLGISTLPIADIFLDSGPSLTTLLVTFVVLAPITGSLVAIRRGYVRRTAIIFVSVLFLTLVVMSWLFGNALYNPIFPGLIPIIFLAGFLISSQAAFIFGILTIVNIFGFYLVEQSVDIPVILASSDTTYYQTFGLTIILFVFYVYIGTRSYNRSFSQLQDTEDSLRESNEELEGIRTYLENEVAANTQQLERRSRYLEAAARVANSSISILNQQEMIDTAAKEISEQFGFYHVGIFLLDERKEWAALQAASSPGGKLMISRNHRLAVGRQGIVGFVTSTGQPRISQDTGTDKVHSPTEELPDTHSEMALPLIARGEIIGAIDIQDSKPEAFMEDDITVLQAMADNIALALENIRLYEQSQENLEETRRIFGEFSQRAWHEAQEKNLLSSYRYFGGAVTRLADQDQPKVVENKVSIPIEVRGVNLGAIEISKGEDGSSWTDDELQLLRTLSDQLGIALDSARLFNESQLRATTEFTIGQINSQLWETMDINSILRTTAQNLRETLSLPELTIRMTSPQVEADPSANGSPNIEELDTNN